MYALGCFVAFYALYLLLAGAVSASELGAGAVASAVAAWFASALHRVERRRFRLREVRWRRVLGRPLLALGQDSVRVGRVLARVAVRGADGHSGAVQVQPFRHGGDDTAQAARRGLVVLGVSFAPNGFVLDLPDGSSAMLVHRLAKDEPVADTEWPV